jgi:hypothetical protein
MPKKYVVIGKATVSDITTVDSLIRTVSIELDELKLVVLKMRVEDDIAINRDLVLASSRLKEAEDELIELKKSIIVNKDGEKPDKELSSKVSQGIANVMNKIMYVRMVMGSINKSKKVPEVAQKAYMNTVLFRIFIWRDVIDELVSNKMVFGFGFGKPFRSKSIEILEWAQSEWQNDGWIAIHNSYLDIIYRKGIIGLVFIFALMLAFLKLVMVSFKKHSFEGIILSCIVLFWLTAANFAEILESPYFAIPFYFIFGIAIKYVSELIVPHKVNP